MNFTAVSRVLKSYRFNHSVQAAQDQRDRKGEKSQSLRNGVGEGSPTDSGNRLSFGFLHDRTFPHCHSLLFNLHAGRSKTVTGRWNKEGAS